MSDNKFMRKYYCPYCNPKYQFPDEDDSGKLICGLCGEYLIKKPYLNLKQIVALLVFFSFLLPLIYLLFYYLNEMNHINKKNYQAYFHFSEENSKELSLK